MGQWISITLVVLVTLVGFITLVGSIDIHDLLQIFENPTGLQIDSLLIIVMGLIVLSQYLESPVNIARIREGILALQRIILNPQANYPLTERIPFLRRAAREASRIIWISLLVISFSILLIDIVGGFPGSLSDPGPLLKKFALVTVGVVFVVIVLTRQKEFGALSERVVETLDLLKQSSISRSVQVFTRAGFHDFLYNSLGSYTSEDVVYVSVFEEPYEKFKDYYYYEKGFMEIWWQTM